MAEHEIDRADIIGQFLVWRNARRSGQRGAQASVAGMIAEQSG